MSWETWMGNESLFRSEIERGHKWQKWLAHRWKRMGFDVSVPDLRIRPTVGMRHDYTDDGDLFIEGMLVETKARRIRFTNPHDYPYPTAFVDSVARFESKRRKPTAYALISEPALSVVIVPMSSRERWWKYTGRDTLLDLKNQWYMCSRDDLKTEAAFLEFVSNCAAVTRMPPN